ncbi:MAG: DUF6056 family protein [Anaerorhabdus sp.]
MLKNKERFIVTLLFILFFMLFAFITCASPLAGDDWGYAINGMKNNPLTLVIDFYNQWSGRILSELWGFLIAPNKWLWNILNPLMFTSIAALMYLIINPKRKKISTTLLIFFLMLSVKDFVRMETYTWIMGSTYIVPLLLFLLYLYLIKLVILDYNNNVWVFSICILLNLVIPLWMENIATTLVFANILILIYFYIHDRSNIKKSILFIVLSVIGLLIIRLSPGAAIRLAGEHSAWLKLSIFDQISRNWNNFLTYTFLDNKYLMLTFSLIMLGVLYNYQFNYKGKKWIFNLLIIVYSFGIIQSTSSFLYSYLNLNFLTVLFDLNSPNSSLILSIFYTIYVLCTIYTFTKFLQDFMQFSSNFLLFIAGSSTIVMLFSPIFGSRSSIYFIYLIILLIGSLYNSLNIDIKLETVITITLITLCLIWTRSYINKYQLVRIKHRERLERIQWIKDNPQTKEAWIERMPIMTIHSADIEDNDTYHQQVFKEYYGLNPNIKLIFYWPE